MMELISPSPDRVEEVIPFLRPGDDKEQSREEEEDFMISILTTVIAGSRDQETTAVLTSHSPMEGNLLLNMTAASLAPPYLYSGNSTGAAVRHLDANVQALLSVIYVLGICGNAAALVMLRRQETQRNKRQTLMLKCLSWNDLLALSGSAVQMHLQLYLPSAWVLNPYFCGVRVFWRAFGLGSGCVALAMAVERWFALTKPFVYQTQVTYQRILRSIFGLWITVTFLACLPFLGFGHFYDHNQVDWKKCSRHRFGTTPEDVAYAYIWFSFGLIMCIVIVSCNLCVIEALHQMNRRSEHRRMTHQVSVNLTSNGSQSVLTAMTENNSGFFGRQLSANNADGTMTIPTMEISPCYRMGSRMNYHQQQHQSLLQRNSSVNSVGAARRRQTQEEIKFARLMIILSIFYVICWIPQLIAIPMGLSNPDRQERIFFRVADICIALNFVLDPYIYVLFRGRCSRCWHCCSCTSCCWCCWPCRKPDRSLESSVACQLAKDDAGGTDTGDGMGNPDLSNRDRDYVPLKTLLMAESTDITDAMLTKENSV